MINVLAIGAHPDDVELGCLGTLLKCKNDGANIYLLVLTMGEASGDPKIREEECREAAEQLGARNIFFGGLKDTKISDGIETIMKIESIIDKVQPTLIFTHSYRDRHQDHRNSSLATLSAGRRTKKILEYESPTTYREFSPQIFVDIGNQFQNKQQILGLFSSQSKKEWWALGEQAAKAVEGLSRYRGFQAGVEFAEAFEVGRLIVDQGEPIFLMNANKK